MLAGGLTQLLAFGAMNNLFPNNYSRTIDTLDATSNTPHEV